MALLRIALLLIFVAPLAAAHAEICRLNAAAVSDDIERFEAVVIGPASDAEVLRQTRIAISRVRAPVSPAYVNLPRIVAVFRDARGGLHRTIAAVLSGPPPAPHAHVTLASRRRDPNQPCAFVPWTVVKSGEAA